MFGFRRRRRIEEEPARGIGRGRMAEEPAGGAGQARAAEREEAPVRRRRGFGARSREGGAAVATAAGAFVLAIARLIMTVAFLIFLLIVLAIVLRDADANPTNAIVEGIHEGANFFAGAFTNLIKYNGHPKEAISVNWGIAAVVYLIVGAFISRLVASIGRGTMVVGGRPGGAVPSH
ncbi:MAG TPA: hypothetical protein VHT27_09385 [Solirubrobacteraceae bacterium]|jgi:hypothetical protein|nr:hypothetical protein [Solirubrobacteraceae bacterium]